MIRNDFEINFWLFICIIRWKYKCYRLIYFLYFHFQFFVTIVFDFFCNFSDFILILLFNVGQKKSLAIRHLKFITWGDRFSISIGYATRNENIQIRTTNNRIFLDISKKKCFIVVKAAVLFCVCSVIEIPLYSFITYNLSRLFNL